VINRRGGDQNAESNYTRYRNGNTSAVERAGHTISGSGADRERQITDALYAIGTTLGFSERFGDADFMRYLIGLLTNRFCGVADTPPKTSGLRILDYGAPIGRWSRGNLGIVFFRGAIL
jgi:hypothetical protein